MSALNFPASPSDGDIYLGYVYDATDGVWNANPRQLASRFITSATQPPTPQNGDGWFNTTNGKTFIYYYDGTSGQWVESGYPVLGYQSIEGLTDTSISTPTAGQKLVYDGTNWVNLTGYVFVQTVYFTSSGTFSKGDYPWLRAIRVKVQGAGGGGGGCIATGANQNGMGGSGSGGAYAESFITNIAGLASSVTVTRGAGGSGGAAGTNSGTNGGASSFGALVSANGGVGGIGSGAGGIGIFFNTGQLGASVGVGDLVIPGGSVRPSFSFNNAEVVNSAAGESFLSGTQPAYYGPGSGVAGVGFGAGGSGGQNPGSNATARAGGAGGDGIVIVELYA